MVIDTKTDKAQAGVAVGDDEFVKELTDNEVVEASTEPIARVTTEDDNPVTVVKRPIYKRPGFLIALVVFLLVAAIFGVRYYTYAASHESTDDAFIDGDIVQISPKVSGHIIKLYVDSNQLVKEGDLLAEIDPRDYQSSVDQAEAALNAAITRQKAARINVALTGKTSHAGVQQATSGVQLARQGVFTSTATVGNVQGKAAQALAQVATAIANAEQARAQVTAAEAEATRTTADVARYEQLFAKDEVSQQQLDVAVAASKSAVAGLEAARKRVASAEAQIAEAQANAAASEQNVKVAESQVGEARARVGTAEGQLTAASAAPEEVASSEAQATTADAEVERAQAALDQAKLLLTYTKIIAPQSGRTARKATEVGNYVQPGQALIAIVPEQVWVVANFKETQLTYMKAGQPVDVRVDTYPGRVFHGHVDSIQPGTGARFSLLPPENASGNYVKVVQRVPVKILLDNLPETNALLAQGMSAEPEVKVK